MRQREVVNYKSMFNWKIIVVIVLLILIIFMVVLLQFRRASEPVSTPVPSAGITQPTPNPSIPAYNPTGLEKDFQRISSKKELALTDREIRDQLIQTLGNKSGVLDETEQYRIEYVKSPNSFMVEILDKSTEEAKLRAIEWFGSKGISDQGICNLPVVFYLSFEIEKQLREQGQSFDPTIALCR